VTCGIPTWDEADRKSSLEHRGVGSVMNVEAIENIANAILYEG